MNVLYPSQPQLDGAQYVHVAHSFINRLGGLIRRRSWKPRRATEDIEASGIGHLIESDVVVTGQVLSGFGLLDIMASVLMELPLARHSAGPAASLCLNC